MKKPKRLKSNEGKQRTFEWYRSRWGKITGSDRIKTIIAGNFVSMNALLEKMAWEAKQNDDVIREAFDTEQATSSDALRWGAEHELEAMRAYEMLNNAECVYSPGFAVHPLFPKICGLSIDFLDESNNWHGEIKCPFNTDNHMRAIKFGMPTSHVDQVQLGLACSPDRPACIFVSYDPRYPDPRAQCYQQLQYRSEEWQARFTRQMERFEYNLRHGRKFENEMSKTVDGIPSMF
jgi:hypothetical protein